MKPCIAFRVDASNLIGTGHVVRCITLALALRKRGFNCIFISRDHVGHLGELIVSTGFELHTLANNNLKGTLSQNNRLDGTAHDQWLSVTWQQDAEQTLDVLSNFDVAWLVVDHYALDAQWERVVGKAVKNVMVIDDLADRDHQADLLLDQNALSPELEVQYRKHAGSDCKLLLGPEYALLDETYTDYVNKLAERSGKVARLLVFVGGSDPYHLTERYLEALQNSAFLGFHVDVVIGRNHPDPERVRDLVTGRPGATLYRDLPSLAPYMVRADLMLGAGGTTNWERMCLGLNAVVVSTAFNQEAICRELSHRGFIQYLGTASEVTVDTISTALRLVVSDPEYLADQSKRMREVVDGAGTRRVVEIMTSGVDDAIATS